MAIMSSAYMAQIEEALTAAYELIKLAQGGLHDTDSLAGKITIAKDIIRGGRDITYGIASPDSNLGFEPPAILPESQNLDASRAVVSIPTLVFYYNNVRGYVNSATISLDSNVQSPTYIHANGNIAWILGKEGPSGSAEYGFRLPIDLAVSNIAPTFSVERGVYCIGTISKFAGQVVAGTYGYLPTADISTRLSSAPFIHIGRVIAEPTQIPTASVFYTRPRVDWQMPQADADLADTFTAFDNLENAQPSANRLAPIKTIFDALIDHVTLRGTTNFQTHWNSQGYEFSTKMRALYQELYHSELNVQRMATIDTSGFSTWNLTEPLVYARNLTLEVETGELGGTISVYGVVDYDSFLCEVSNQHTPADAANVTIAVANPSAWPTHGFLSQYPEDGSFGWAYGSYMKLPGGTMLGVKVINPSSVQLLPSSDWLNAKVYRVSPYTTYIPTALTVGESMSLGTYKQIAFMSIAQASYTGADTYKVRF